ncbi:hypothetical protein [Thiomicrospira sp. ALE5]|uniref:hypothetical protein n=1 Tax=Thiomicrospira sp. ALE5 TaxID=748650 RepID=UPI0008EA78A8|nr:hypothetical protein [Thiomicrospira sp. ALE5]SFR54919.1 hypothetical protein SAMN03092900_1072 [Thiomicrospira sp. ALE5]
MYAIEFEADVVNEYLKISNFEQFKNKHARVVIETDDAPRERQRLSALAIDARDFKFNRDEANER